MAIGGAATGHWEVAVAGVLGLAGDFGYSLSDFNYSGPSVDVGSAFGQSGGGGEHYGATVSPVGHLDWLSKSMSQQRYSTYSNKYSSQQSTIGKIFSGIGTAIYCGARDTLDIAFNGHPLARGVLVGAALTVAGPVGYAVAGPVYAAEIAVGLDMTPIGVWGAKSFIESSVQGLPPDLYSWRGWQGFLFGQGVNFLSDRF